MPVHQPRLNIVCFAFILILLLSTIQVLRNESENLVSIAEKFLTMKNMERSQDSRSCDSECEKFRELMRSWTPTKPKAAIVILTHSKGNRKRELKLMLNHLNLHFLNKYQYPIIIFHEKNDRPFIDEVKRFKTNGTVFFQEVEFQIPEFVDKSRVAELSCGRSIGYRHMCRFHAKLLYELPIINELEFVFRLDDDSLITEPINYDLFKYMKDKDIFYGYVFNQTAKKECVETLWNATKQYIDESGIKPTFFNEWPEYHIFYNNFELSKVEFWKSKQYRNYVDYIDRSGGVYYHRWGDAPIKSLGLSLFMPKGKLHRFSGIGYKHHYRINKPS